MRRPHRLPGRRQAGSRAHLPVLDKDGKRLPDYTIPSDTDIARQPNAEQINYGKRLLNETRRLLQQHRRQHELQHCHVQQGKSRWARRTSTR